MGCDSSYMRGSESDDLRGELNLAVRLLCETLTELKNIENTVEVCVNPLEAVMTPELKSWWTRHQRADLVKIIQEVGSELSRLASNISEIKKLGGLVTEQMIEDERRLSGEIESLEQKLKEVK